MTTRIEKIVENMSYEQAVGYLARKIDDLCKPIELVIEKLYEDVTLPTKAHNSDVCFDIYAYSDPIITSKYIEYKTGFRVQIPEGYGIDIFARSSVSNTDLILANGTGIVDTNYRGEWICRYKIIPFVDNPTLYKKGDKIAQFRLHKKIETILTEGIVTTDTDRSIGGFGSSGK